MSNYRLKLKYFYILKNPERPLKSKPVTAIVMMTRETVAAINPKGIQKTHVRYNKKPSKTYQRNHQPVGKL